MRKNLAFSKSKLLLFGIILNLLFSATEAGAGVIFQSLALISDALHNVGDVAAIWIGLWAYRLSRKRPSESNTFGYKNAESLAVLINSVSLVVVCLYLLLEGFYRLILEPTTQTNGWMVFWVALIGIAVNLVITAMFYPLRKNNNFYLILLHSATDALVSAGVAVSGLAMVFFQVYWLDSVASILIGVLIITCAVPSLFGIYTEIMKTVPKGQSVTKIRELILAQSNKIKAVHHIHIWKINQYETALEAHVVIDDETSMSIADSLKNQIKAKIGEKFKINHSLLEMELEKNSCDSNQNCY